MTKLVMMWSWWEKPLEPFLQRGTMILKIITRKPTEPKIDVKMYIIILSTTIFGTSILL